MSISEAIPIYFREWEWPWLWKRRSGQRENKVVTKNILAMLVSFVAMRPVPRDT
jgi:hypothetical protein